MTENRVEHGERGFVRLWGRRGGGGYKEKREAKSGDSETGDRKLRSSKVNICYCAHGAIKNMSYSCLKYRNSSIRLFVSLVQWI